MTSMNDQDLEAKPLSAAEALLTEMEKEAMGRDRSKAAEMKLDYSRNLLVYEQDGAFVYETVHSFNGVPISTPSREDLVYMLTTLIKREMAYGRL